MAGSPNEIIPVGPNAASLVAISPSTIQENGGQFIVQANTTQTVSGGATVSYSIHGLTANQVVGGAGALTGTLTIASGQSSSNQVTITLQNDNVFEGVMSCYVVLTSSTGGINYSTNDDNFTVLDDASYYWNGGAATPVNGPAYGGSGTWSTSNAWIAIPGTLTSGSVSTWNAGVDGNYSATLPTPVPV